MIEIWCIIQLSRVECVFYNVFIWEVKKILQHWKTNNFYLEIEFMMESSFHYTISKYWLKLFARAIHFHWPVRNCIQSVSKYWILVSKVVGFYSFKWISCGFLLSWETLWVASSRIVVNKLRLWKKHDFISVNETVFAFYLEIDIQKRLGEFGEEQHQSEANRSRNRFILNSSPFLRTNAFRFRFSMEQHFVSVSFTGVHYKVIPWVD